MSTVYDNGISAGGYTNNDEDNSGSSSSGTLKKVDNKNPIGYDSNGNVNAIYSGIIVEDVTRQFVNSNEKYYINKVIEKGMFKDVYDLDEDGIVDMAKNAENANYATRASKADSSDTSITATTASHSLTADTASIALVAKSLENNGESTTVSEEQIQFWNNKQDKIEYTPENVLMKGMSNGYAPLNEECKIDETYLYNTRWETIQNKPISIVDDIDDAVVKKHTHSNKNSLDRISENPNGLPIWNLQEWPYPGDMKKKDYDIDEDGIIDRAKSADTVLWKNIVSKPESLVVDIDDAVSKKHYHNNLDSLSLISKDDNNLPLWNNSTWPYDMSQSMYDKDKDGVIDEATFARSSNWDNINNRPISTIEEIDEAVNKVHEHTNKVVLDSINENTNNDTDIRLTYNGKELAYKEDINITTDEEGHSITSRFSIEIDPDSKSIQLTNDKAFPEANMYYGTDSNQNRGYHKLPEFNFTGVNSVKVDILGRLSLENDNPTPEPNMYYGTNSNGIRGYYQLPELPNNQPTLPSEIDANIIVQDSEHRFVNDELLADINKIKSIEDRLDEKEASEIIEANTFGNGCRECMISIPSDFFILDGSDLIIKANKDTPAILSFSVNKTKEIIIQLINNLTLPNIPSTINSGTAYIFLFIDKDTNTIKVGKTQYKPIYSSLMPNSFELGRYWFNINTYTMYVSNGNTYLPTEEPTLFVGEITAVSGKVNKIVYACNGMYDSGWYNVSYSTTYNKNHNLGTDLVSITAYRGLDGVNLGEFAFAIHGGATIMDNSNYGDRVSKVTDTYIQTTRYNKMQYSDTVYGSSNQHRVIVKRLW